MRASSQAALERAQERWEPVLRQAGERGRVFGDQLFGVVDILDTSAALRRALTEPSRAGEDKAGLARDVLSGKVDAEVVDLVSGLVRERWSEPGDLADALELLAADSVLAAAEHAGRIEQVEAETFRLERILADQRELRLALTDKETGAERRGQLMARVLAGKVAPETAALAVRAAAHPRNHTLSALLRTVADQAAARRERLVASVTSAVPLSDAQIDRLTRILERQHGRAVQVHVALDPDVVGGLRIQVGDDVVDATLASRLADARRRLAG